MSQAYGDGRAVPMLRGYLERNRDLDRALYYEIVGTIRSLGGRNRGFPQGLLNRVYRVSGFWHIINRKTLRPDG